MYRTVNDFLTDWSQAAKGTERVLEALTDEALGQAIAQDHNTLGWLGWHLATTIPFFSGLLGLNVKSPGAPNTVPNHASEIVQAYRLAAEQVKQQVEAALTDDKMVETVESFGQQTPRGALLRAMIDHQTHHRGQMTVLLRQAGLTVPGVMGPTKEEAERMRG